MSKILLLLLPLSFALVEAIPSEDEVAEAWEAIEGLMDEDERLGAKFLRLGQSDTK